MAGNQPQKTFKVVVPRQEEVNSEQLEQMQEAIRT